MKNLLWNIFIAFSVGAGLAAMTVIASASFYIRTALETIN